MSADRLIFPALTPDRLFEIDRRAMTGFGTPRTNAEAIDNVRRMHEVEHETLLQILLEAMRRRGYLTLTSAWEIGHAAGFYVGGDGSVTKDDLNKLAQRNQAVRHDGYWRHAGEPEHMKAQYKIWSDYWAPR